MDGSTGHVKETEEKEDVVHVSSSIVALLTLRHAGGPIHDPFRRASRSGGSWRNRTHEIRSSKGRGVVTDVRSGLYTVRTPTGTTYTLAESVAVRYGREVPNVGDEMILWINKDNNIMDAKKKGASKMAPHFISGNLVSINHGKAQVRFSISGEEKSFELRPESQKYTDMAVGTPVTIAVNEAGEVVDLHVDKDSGAPRSGLDHPDNESALKGFRHLGKP